MGGKQTWRRKHVYLYVAVLILAGLFGCALQRVQTGQDAAEPYAVQPAPKESPSGVVHSEKEKEPLPAPPDKKRSGDEALFLMALTYADAANPARDYARSARYLKRLIQEYPASPLAEQARILAGLIQETDQLRRTIDKLNAIMEESKKVDVEIEQKRREMQR